MMTDIVFSLEQVCKDFRIYKGGVQKIQGLFRFGREVGGVVVNVLADINLEVKRGETLGIIGLNGAGKSTLLQIIAGILHPTKGTVKTKGKIVTMMDLGLGFHPEFTGAENVVMKGIIMGYSKRDMMSRLDRISDFAEIHEYMDQPVRTYSSGMLLRLAFAAAVHTDPDILLIDEVLAVGDISFQYRCMEKIREFQRDGKTIILVSHDLNMSRAICSRCALLSHGRLVEVGDPIRVTDMYEARYYHGQGKEYSSCGNFSEFIDKTGAALRYGIGKMRLSSIQLKNETGKELCVVKTGEKIKICVTIEFLEDCKNPLVGYVIRNTLGQDLFGNNNYYTKEKIIPRKTGDKIEVEIAVSIPLNPGQYFLSVGVGEETPAGLLLHDNMVNVLNFEVVGGAQYVGIFNVETNMRVFDISPPNKPENKKGN